MFISAVSTAEALLSVEKNKPVTLFRKIGTDSENYTKPISGLWAKCSFF
jgi:hypothetical protein